MDMMLMIARFMDYCHSKQLRPKTMSSYEQTLKLFARWLEQTKHICMVEKIKDEHIRAYIIDLQKRGKYTFCINDRSKLVNHANKEIYSREALLKAAYTFTDHAYLHLSQDKDNWIISFSQSFLR